MKDERIDNPRNTGTIHKDATQRVYLDDALQQRPSRATSKPAPKRRKKKHWHVNKREKAALITLGSITAVLIIAAVVMLSTMFQDIPDDGLILKGVNAAGVDLGGMTPEQAMEALTDVNTDTYTKLDMMVSVHGETIKLSPLNTGANLDVQAVVDAAYNYGRTGSRTEREQAKKHAQTKSVTISIVDYLNLDKNYIRNEIIRLGDKFSTTLTQTEIEISGNRPEMGVSKPDTNRVYQSLTIKIGNAEYALDTNKLYKQVLEYYNMNIFQVVDNCPITGAPDSVDEEIIQFYQENCVEPEDAVEDPFTGQIIKNEVYGYGFNLDAVLEQINNARFGATIVVPLKYLTPNITEDFLSGNRFKDTMGESSSPLGIDDAWNHNVNLVCQKLNGVTIKSGAEFSFNAILGELTEEMGYQKALAHVGRVSTQMVGGGISHVSSVLYNCLLQAELNVTERHTHIYAVNFIENGLDAYVNPGIADLRFINSYPDPIRIKAAVVENAIQISIEGIDNRTHLIQIGVVVKDTLLPGTLYNTMIAGNPGNYVDGQELVPGINGYVIEVYANRYDKATGQLENQEFRALCRYEAKDAVVVKIINEPSLPTTPVIPDLT